MKDYDFTAPVGALREEASVSIEGPSQDRVRLSVATEGGGEEFYVVFDAVSAQRLATRMAQAAISAAGHEGVYKLVAVRVDIEEEDDEPKGEVIFEADKEAS